MPSVTTGALRPLAVGVLGCADIALRKFLPAIVQSTKVQLMAIASRDAEKATAVARRYGCAARGYRELLRSSEIDLVYIPLPNHLHEEWAIKALEHGKHVLCEKPLGLSHGSVHRLLDAARGNGLLLYENIMYLQHPQHGHIRDLLTQGMIGTVTGLECVFTFPGPERGNFRLDPRMGGGAFHDLNRYPLSAAQYFLKGDMGDIISCNITRKDTVLSSMKAEARTTADERFTFHIAFGEPYRSSYEITGSEGTLRLERAFTTPADHECCLETCCNGKRETALMPSHDHFRLTIDHVATLIAGGDFAETHDRWHTLALHADRFLQHASPQGSS